MIESSAHTQKSTPKCANAPPLFRPLLPSSISQIRPISAHIHPNNPGHQNYCNKEDNGQHVEPEPRGARGGGRGTERAGERPAEAAGRRGDGGGGKEEAGRLEALARPGAERSERRGQGREEEGADAAQDAEGTRLHRCVRARAQAHRKAALLLFCGLHDM